MVYSFITKWYSMSRKFSLTEKQREGIANRIREVITEHDYSTFTEFSKEYGISRQTIQHWITEGKINIAFLFEFCDDFNLDLRWVLIGSPYPKHKKPTQK